MRSTRKLNVVVGRMDNNIDLEVENGTTITQALEKAGYTRASNETIQDPNGNEYDGSETANEGKAYFLVQNVKSGQ